MSNNRKLMIIFSKMRKAAHHNWQLLLSGLSLHSLNEDLQLYINPASEPRSSGHKHSLYGRIERLLPRSCLMLLAGLQDVGHEDVATGCGDLSLRSLHEALQLYSNPASEPRRSSHKCSCYGREKTLSLRTSSYACRVCARLFSTIVNPASTARSSGHKHDLYRRIERLLPRSCLMLLVPDQAVSAL